VTETETNVMGAQPPPSGQPARDESDQIGYALCVRGMSKSFDGVTVLDSLDLDIAPGEVHGLIGENGSGKSTFVKLLGGVHTPDESGSCEIWGRPLQFPVLQPQQHGLAIIHQDLALNDGMSVAENIEISTGFGRRLLQPFSSRTVHESARRLSTDYGLQLNPNSLVGTLQPAERSVVAILRGLRSLRVRQEHGVLILDEPTAALPHEESKRLLSIIRALADAGNAVLFISHRLKEVLTVCDQISVLRSGKLIGTVDAAGTTDTELVQMMLGYDIGAFYPDLHEPVGARTVLRVSHLSGGTVANVNFSVGEGEILGVTGLVGMGQDEIPYLLNGHARSTTGEVSLLGTAVPRSVRGSQAAGIVLVPGNRLRDSVWVDGTAVENLTLPFVSRFSRGVLRHRAENNFAENEMKRFGVRPLTPTRKIARFSGGNQQKIVLARWLQTNPKVLLLHEPTQGVDAGAKREIFELIRDVADAGTAVVLFSSDIEEVANVCHRVVIMRHGGVSGELRREQLSEEVIIAACQGTHEAAWKAENDHEH
jgi:ribose transport system ATP-binding protein